MATIHSFQTRKQIQPILPTRQQPIILIDITLPNGKTVDLTMVPELGDGYTETPDCVVLTFPAGQQTVTFMKANLTAFAVKHTVRTVPDLTPEELTQYLATLDAQT